MMLEWKSQSPNREKKGFCFVLFFLVFHFVRNTDKQNNYSVLFFPNLALKQNNQKSSQTQISFRSPQSGKGVHDNEAAIMLYAAERIVDQFHIQKINNSLEGSN